MLMSSNPNQKKQFALIFALAVFSGTAFAGIDEIARDAKRGKKNAQLQLSAHYQTGDEVVRDELLAEQWLLRSDVKISVRSAGNALAALQAKRGIKAVKTEVPSPQGVRENTSERAFLQLLRSAAQGQPAALQRFRSDENLRKVLQSYAQTPEGKRDPFVREVIKRLRNK